MEIKLIIVVFIVVSSLSAVIATNICNVYDREDCIYTVVCVSYAGNAFTPDCVKSEIFVTFVIRDSDVPALTAGFFGTTNFDSRVRVIKGVSNSWPTIESLAFKYYTRTLQIDISNNKIENINVDAFKNLYLLTTLNISNNVIQNLNSKSFHISDSRIPELSTLDLSGNLLSDLSENWFAGLQNLRQLYLQNNRIIFLLDTTFSDLKSLTVLNLSKNKITALNSSLSQIKTLKNLDMSFNQLTQLFGYETNMLTALEMVNMSYNLIEVIESNCFNQAFNLEEVDFRHNKIESSIESLTFINNNKLKFIDFSENHITGIQDNAFQHNVLKILNLYRNNLTGEITQNTFNGLNSVISLNLCNQSITIIRENAFFNAKNLLNLNISLNNIQLIENSSFPKDIAITILDISQNNVSDLNFLINSLQYLTEIYLQRNNLVIIPKDAFSEQTMLIKIDISYNQIESIEPHSLSLQNLQYLNLNGNHLFGILNSAVFSSAKFLRNLDLSNFKLIEINESALVDLPSVARMNISYNEIEFIDPNNFEGMNNMYSLDLSYNKLTCFYLKNSSLINLKALYLNNNNLSNISRTLITMTGLLYVDLSNNNISDLSDVSFKSLYNLKVLHLSHNNIRVFNNPQTNALVKLTDLSIAGNQLTELNLSYFGDIVTVDVSHNKISFFNSSFFSNLDSLQMIDLSGNMITQINPGTFQKLKMLKFLNLSHNMLSVLRYGSFRGLNRTEVMDVSYNNLSNIDVDVFHECIELRRLIIDYNYLRTLDVERLVETLPKLTKLSIGGNQLSCKEIVRNIKSVNRNLIRQVDVTSIDKLYHEDNVHGIKCGQTNATTAAETVSSPAEASSSLMFIIWCSFLTVIVLIVLGLFLFRSKLKMFFYEPNDYRLQFRNSVSRLSNATNDTLLH